MPTINLLPQKISKQQRTARVVTKATSIGFIVCAVLVVIAFGLGIYRFFLGRHLASLEEQATSLETTILSKAELEEISDKLSNKSGALSLIFSTRDRYSYLIETFINMIPQGVYFSDFSVGSNGGISTNWSVNVSGTALSYISLSEFLRIIPSPEGGGDVFESAKLSSVSLDDNSGKIRFAILLGIKQNALKEPIFK